MVRILVDFAIQEGQLDAFEDIALQMIAISQQELGILGYQWYLSADRTRCRIIGAYADEESVLEHFSGQALHDSVTKLLEHSSANRFEVYGDPGPQASALLVSFGAEIFASWHGFIL